MSGFRYLRPIRGPRWMTYGISVAFVVVMTLAAQQLHDRLGVERLSMVFLVSVVASAMFLGRGPAILAALLSFAAYDFYLLEPRLSFSMAVSEGLVILGLFLVFAFLASHLAAWARDREQKAAGRARALSVLFEASRTLGATGDGGQVSGRLPEILAWAAGTEAAVQLEGGPLLRATADGQHEEIPASLLSATRDPGRTIRSGRWKSRALWVGDRRLGAAFWRAPEAPPLRPAHDRRADPEVEADRLIEAIVNVGAGAVLRETLERETVSAA